MLHSPPNPPSCLPVYGGNMYIFSGKCAHSPTGSTSWGPRPWLQARRPAGPGSRSNEPRQQGAFSGLFGISGDFGRFFANLLLPFPSLFNPPRNSAKALK